MAENEQNDESKKPTSGADPDLLKVIKSYFCAGNLQDTKTALNLCAENGIDPKQFELYYRPEEEKPCPNGNSNGHTSPLNKVLESVEPKITEPDSVVEKIEKIVDKEKSENIIITNPDNILVNSIKGKEIPFYDNFPYKESELRTLSKPSLVNIINGCFSSYSSRELMRVFNPKEFLGKMAGITDLKRQDIYLRKIKFNIEKNGASVDEVFDNIITYLDNIAYKHNSWSKQAVSIRDIYSTAKNEQKHRISHIPEVDKMMFIDSVFHKPLDYVSNHNYIHKSNFDKLLGAGTKTGYATFLIKQLTTKWNNMDNVK